MRSRVTNIGSEHRKGLRWRGGWRWAVVLRCGDMGGEGRSRVKGVGVKMTRMIAGQTKAFCAECEYKPVSLHFDLTRAGPSQAMQMNCSETGDGDAYNDFSIHTVTIQYTAQPSSPCLTDLYSLTTLHTAPPAHHLSIDRHNTLVPPNTTIATITLTTIR
jgi:hypothetical protein